VFPEANARGASSFALPLEYVLGGYAEGPGQPERQQQRWRVFARLQRDDRLPRSSHAVGQLLLRHLAMLEW